MIYKYRYEEREIETMSDNLIIALSKGRILEETLPLIKAAGIEPLENVTSSRKLIFDTTVDNVKMIILRATDVPSYVQFGGADIGVTGKDVLMEHGADGLYEPLDLGIAKCRLMTAAKKNTVSPSGRIKVATKFVKLAKAYYASKGIQTDIIKLYGAMELAPLLGLADEIVDIVDTGNTLKANGLEPRELIHNISTRLVVNKASMKMNYSQIQPILELLKAAVSH